jgi:hypothetical protein
LISILIPKAIFIIRIQTRTATTLAETRPYLKGLSRLDAESDKILPK